MFLVAVFYTAQDAVINSNCILLETIRKDQESSTDPLLLHNNRQINIACGWDRVVICTGSYRVRALRIG
jgi:hypothetical protein